MIDPALLEATVRALATPAGRLIGTPGHDAAREFLIAAMGDAALAPLDADGFEHPYALDGIEFTNLVGQIPGSDPSLPPVLIGAHYDTCGPLPGADDNAAAIAIAIAAIEPLRAARLERSVIVAFFDAEEPPHFSSERMGSTRWYDDQRRGEVHCALIMDLVGHALSIPSMEDIVFVLGMETDPGLEAVFRAAATEAPVRALPTLTRYIGDMSDYRAFRLARCPYLFLSCGQWEHYHAPTDTPDVLDYEKMAGIAELLIALTVGAARTELAGPFDGVETIATELEYFRAAAGPLLDLYGVTLESRDDMDGLARLLTGYFLSG